MNPRFLKALLKHPDRYPQNLDERYPRVLEQIAQLWGTLQLEPYLHDLLYDTRGDRKGFPPDVMIELMFLHGLAAELQSQAGEDPWGDVKNKDEEGPTLPGNDVQSLLERAVREGNQPVVRRLLASGGSPHRRASNGATLLGTASLLGFRTVAGLLVESGADVSAPDDRGFVPLHWAAFKDHHTIVELLLERGASPNVVSSTGVTPLHQAAASGGAQSVELLLRAGAQVNVADKEGSTPLHRALGGFHVRVAKMLDAAGADWTAKHRSGITPADLVARDERLASLARLIPAAQVS
ncbi:MAG TPA: ankyrin repeat domain-containing protein [Burkholderiales bacterium]|nr:ankyrin repeat domain-containing protein [Burkholderiales bacterium]